MRRPYLLHAVAVLALAGTLGACTQKNTADEQDQQAAAAALGIDRLLLFPNPIGTDPLAQDGGTFETNTTDYATAYYAAIDATNAKDTIDKWKTANLFDTVGNGTQHLAVFRDVKDLGYGRRMTGRRNISATDTKIDGSVAFFVENYNVAPNGSAGYSSNLNVDAAIRRDTQWHVGTNAIEWSTAPCTPGFDPTDCDPNAKFAKYYNFSSVDGTRQLAVDLDGHGKKAMPGPCITCHGGRGDPLTPPDLSGNPRFPLVENLPSRKRGDVGARLHGMNVDSFGFSTTQAGFAKTDLQPFLKDFNQWILCTYPSPTATPGLTVTGGWGVCTRPTAGQNEWQGTAGPMIESWYGGTGANGMPSATFADTYVPAGWNTNTAIAGTTPTLTDTALYQGVVEPHCRTCHILRGTKNQDDLDFMKLGVPAAGATPATGFLSFADRIKVHVFDRGNMPLAQIPHSDFWSSSAPQMLANFIDAQLGAGTATANGAPLMPGRPIADPGPDRMVRTGANAVLTGENSLFASSFSWTSVSGPSNPTISNANGMVAIFNATVAGPYVVNLSVNGGTSTKNVNITVDDNFPDPLNIKFAQVKNVLQNVSHSGTAQQCISCHTTTANVAAATRVPPIWYNNFDRDGSGGAVDTTDDDWFLKALAGRVNLTEIGASPLLRKPTGNHHNGLKVIDPADASTNGNGGLRNYSILYNWILAGMQPGGVAANPIVSASNTLTFSGSPLYSTGIALDGTTSVGPSANVPPTNFLWTVSGPSGPTGAVPVISNPTSPSAVLFVPNVTTATPYVVQLHVDDGVSSDAVQRSITVSEPTIGASFSPTTGPVLPTSPALGRGNITLHSTSSYIAPVLPGIPATCHWQVLSVPAGASVFLDGSSTLGITKPCATDAMLNVPTTPAGGQYQVQLTASTLGTSNPVTNTLTISSSAPTASLAATASSFAKSFVGTVSNMNVATYDSAFAPANFLGFATPAIVQSSTSVTLDGSSSTTPVGSLIYSWCLTSQPDATNFAASIPVCPSQTSSGASSTTGMNVRATGSYTVQLTVDNGSTTSSVSKIITVTTTQGKTFGATIVPVIGATPCDGCHQVTGPLTGVFNTASGSGFPPAWANANTLGGTATTLYQRVRQRVDLVTPTASKLIVCPNASCDSGGMPAQPNFSATGLGSNYDNFLKWIQDGAPPGN